jgi:GT2 family glycosyltransferase
VGLVPATGHYVILLNNDTELNSECLPELVHFLDARPEVGRSAGRSSTRMVPTRERPGAFPRNGLFGRRSALTSWFPNNPWSRRYMVGRHHGGDAPFEVEILSSACLMLRTDLARRLGGMDEGFELYWVDAELCYRVRAHGYKIYCVPRARLVHYEGKGGSTRTWRQRCRATAAFHGTRIMRTSKCTA